MDRLDFSRTSQKSLFTVRSHTGSWGHWPQPTYDVPCSELCRSWIYDSSYWVWRWVIFYALTISYSVHLFPPTGSKPIAALERLPKMQLCYIPELPKLFRRLPFLILAPIKIIHQIIHILLWLLVWIDIPPEFILVQVSLKL